MAAKSGSSAGKASPLAKAEVGAIRQAATRVIPSASTEKMVALVVSASFVNILRTSFIAPVLGFGVDLRTPGFRWERRPRRRNVMSGCCFTLLDRRAIIFFLLSG